MGTICGKKDKKKKQEDQVRVAPEDKKEDEIISLNHANQISSELPITSKQQTLVATEKPKESKPFVPKRLKIKETVKAVRKTNVEGQKMLNEYIFLDFLGQGQFGKVKLAQKDGKKYAVKIFKKSKLKRKKEFSKDKDGNILVKDALQDVQREIAIMKKVKHPNCIRLFEVIDNPQQDKLYLIMELAEPGQLIEWDDDEQKFFFTNFDREDPISEDQLRGIFRDSLKGINALHNNGIIHRDLKPQNILIGEDGKAKITDFGVSTIVKDNDNLNNNQGTYHFMAPETLSAEKSQGYSGRAADLWSLGVTFFAFTYLAVPFNGESVQDLITNIKEQEQNSEKYNIVRISFPDSREVSDGLKQLLRKMLQKMPSERQFDKIINDEWLNAGMTHLSQEIQLEQIIVEDVSEKEIENAYSIATIVMIKKWVNNWKSMRIIGKSQLDIKSEKQISLSPLPKQFNKK